MKPDKEVTAHMYNNSIDSLVDEMIDRHIDGQDEFEMVRAFELNVNHVIMNNGHLLRVRSVHNETFTFSDFYDCRTTVVLRISTNSRQWVLRKK